MSLTLTSALAVTPEILRNIYQLLNLRLPLHSALWALSLVAFFTFLRKSNLVVNQVNSISPKVPLLSDLDLQAGSATITIRATKTIQFKQRCLVIPLPFIRDSPLCPVTALKNHLEVNKLTHEDASKPLFSVFTDRASNHVPLTYANFSAFIKRATKLLGLDSRQFSPHSFRRGGATFAFSCSVPAELIQHLGDWRSDAYLVYLDMSTGQKLQATSAMAQRIHALFPYFVF